MGLLGDLIILNEDLKKNREKKDNKCLYSDEEINAYNLTPEEKDLVKKGLYDPWNFEEEELEEDDFYYEDDEK